MKIIFWTVIGLRHRTKRRMVAEVLRDNRAAIFCLEETKLEDASNGVEQEFTLRRNFELIFKKGRGLQGESSLASIAIFMKL